jgi:XTP/dITP diphosphohydrolase
VLTVLRTSPRVAPGLLSLQAWDALRGARRVLAGSPDHPLLPALAEAGIGYEVVAPGDAVHVLAAADGPVVWLAEPGDDGGGDAERFSLPDSPPVEVIAGSRDLPGARLLDLVATMDTLRAQCPWDAKQTHASLAPHLLEEPYEALEALETGDDAAFREELGDVLLQVVFHARIAAERSDGYTIDDVADGIVAKLVRRHPHVFADLQVADADEVKRNWDEIKKAERAERGVESPSVTPSVLDGVPFGQPALALAAQLQRRAARAGVPADLAPGSPVGAANGDDLGGQLLRLVAAAREAGLDPELELRAAARRYRDLVRDWEQSRRQ